MVCLFPIAERAHTHTHTHTCTNPGTKVHCNSSMKWTLRACCWGYVRYEILEQKRGKAIEGIRCRLPQGPLVPHYNSSISSFSLIWIEAPLTMTKGCRTASCPVLSTPESYSMGNASLTAQVTTAVEMGFSGDKNTVLHCIWKEGLSKTWFLFAFQCWY